jgi:hypothetical protein
MATFPVNGHFLSTKSPSIASLGVLKPKNGMSEINATLTESNLFVKSDTTSGLFGNELFGVEEDSYLFLVGFFMLRLKKRQALLTCDQQTNLHIPVHLSSLVVKYTKE